MRQIYVVPTLPVLVHINNEAGNP